MSPNDKTCFRYSSVDGERNISPGGVTLVLTATVDPKNTFYTTRRDPITRLKDYETSLRRWLENQSVTKLVFCENSGFDLKPIYDLCSKYSRSFREIEILSFHGQNFNPDFGKGFGEIGILAYVAAHSRLLRSTTYMLKVTGRLYVRNVHRIIRGISDKPTIDVFCNLFDNLASADSRVFGCNRRFLEGYLLPRQDSINDSQGRYFESALSAAVHHALASGMRWSLLPVTPRIYGSNATYDIQYPSSFLYWISREAFRIFKAFVLAR